MSCRGQFEQTDSKPNKKRNAGRPRKRWLDRVKNDLKRNGTSIEDADDRKGWRALVEAKKKKVMQGV